MAILLKTCFDIAGSREGQEIWKLSQKEAELIAEPLSTILNKNPVIGAVTSKYGDVIALVVAIATVLLPRLLVAWAARPQKKKGVQPYVATTKLDGKPKNPATSGNQSPADGNNHRQFTGKPSNTSEILSGKLHHIIPSIQ